MHVDDDTGKTIGQYGQTTIQGRKATFHTTCVAQKMQTTEDVWLHAIQGHISRCDMAGL